MVVMIGLASAMRPTTATVFTTTTTTTFPATAIVGGFSFIAVRIAAGTCVQIRLVFNTNFFINLYTWKHSFRFFKLRSNTCVKFWVSLRVVIVFIIVVAVDILVLVLIIGNENVQEI